MKRAATTALILSLFAASATMADSPRDRGDNASSHRYSHDRKHDDRKDWRHERRDHDRSNDRRHDDRRDRYHDRRDFDRYRHAEHRYGYDRQHFRGRFHAGEYRRPHGYYTHYWRRGERLPRAYYARHYVLYDFHRCGLRAPPRGHHWVRVNHDALLVAIATGIVLDAVYDNFY